MHTSCSQVTSAPTAQPAVSDVFKSHADKVPHPLHVAQCEWFAACNIPWHVADHPSFKEFLRKAAENPQVNPANKAKVSGEVLDYCDKVASLRVQDVLRTHKPFGVTLQHDGARNKKRDAILTSTLTTRAGPLLLQATNASGKYKNAEYLADDMEAAVDLAGGEDIVFCVVVDGAGLCGLRELQRRRPRLLGVRCMAHAYDLPIKDITKVVYSEINAKVLAILNFITSYGGMLAAFRSTCAPPRAPS